MSHFSKKKYSGTKKIVVPSIDELFCSPYKLLYKNQLLPVIRTLFQYAKSKIYLCQYEFFLKPGSSKYLLNNLAHDLHSAASRGVDCFAILNSCFHSPPLKLKQYQTASELNTRGVKTKLWHEQSCCHVKLIVVDSEYLLLGSHNLSLTSLTKNIELSIAIKNSQLAEDASSIFESLWQEC